MLSRVRPVLLMRWLPVLVMSAFLLTSPYTKVEESFNMQAMHDVLYVNSWFAPDPAASTTGYWHVSLFDHNRFPGVVPRTFVGAIAVAFTASPLVRLVDMLLPGATTRIASQLLCRWTLGLMACGSVEYMCRAMGPRTAAWLAALCASQFHVMYYASRALPNTYALILVCIAMGMLLRARNQSGLALLGFTAAVFRSDMFALAAPVGLSLVSIGRVSFWRGALVGISSACIGVALTCPIDSYFWGRWVWPEGVVLFYNTVQNESHRWGRMPPWFYFTSALPRAFTTTLPWIVFGCVQMRHLWPLSIPVWAFVALYSLLPHKEMRFIMPVFPVMALPLARWGR